VLDTPGFTDFQGEVQQAIRVSDAVVIVVDATAGPEVGTELAMQFASDFNQPVLVVINKMDRENTNFDNVMSALQERFSDHKFVPITMPIGSGEELEGVINVVTQKAYMGKGDKSSDVPGDYQDALEAAHLEVVEAAAEADDTYIEKYFDTGELDVDEIRDGMRKAARNADLNTIPVFVTSADKNVGILPLMEALTVYVQPASGRRVATKADPEAEEYEFLNPPQSDDGPLVAYVFKSVTDKYGTLSYFRIFSGSLDPNAAVYNPNTEQEERLVQLMTVRGKEHINVDAFHAGDIGVVAKLKNTRTGDTLTTKNYGRFVLGPRFLAPVYSVALHPRTQSDSAKLTDVLKTLTDADRTLQWYSDPATRQTVLSGMGSVQIDIAMKRAERLGCGIDTTIPKVPYQETIKKTATAVYRHKKQTGGAGQFAEVHLRLEPTSPDEDFVFESEVFGGAISGPFIQSTEKGVRQVLNEGVIIGFPVVGVKAIVFDGKEHPVDSKDIAFQIAGRGAFREAFEKGGPTLLEPIMNLRVTVPEENTGDIIGDITTRRGRVQGMDTVGGQTVINAQVPLAEILRYSNDLRSMTGGRGVFSMEHSHYEAMPSHIQEKVIAEYEAEQEEA
jgi:elongation factor G